MKYQIVIGLLVTMLGLAACGKSEQEIAQEAQRQEAAQRIEAEKQQAEAEKVERQETAQWIEAEKQQAEAQKAQRQEAEEKAAAEKMQEFQDQVRSILKDGESAQFRNLRFNAGQWGEVLCGEVNAKNSFGGYIGFVPFASTERPLAGGQRVIVLSERDDLAFMHRSLIKGAGCGE